MTDARRKAAGQTRMEVYWGPNGIGRTQWYCGARMPSLISKAAKATGRTSMADYIRQVLLAQVAKDLNMSYDELLAEQPHKRNNHLYADPYAWGHGNEDVI